MAYGTSAGVTLLVGGVDTTFFTTANMDIAIAYSDVLVDAINSGASANAKIYASNMIASEIMLFARGNLETKGLGSDAGHIGSSAKSVGSHIDHMHPGVKWLLRGQKPRVSFNTTTPDTDGTW